MLLFQTEICSSALTDVINAVVNGTDGCLFCFGHAGLVWEVLPLFIRPLGRKFRGVQEFASKWENRRFLIESFINRDLSVGWN
ncbi:unnamed protein product [Leptidea sinapis]|uniref:Uncharacterized protein n=1 Tax=Leptidea sinapis TaxID=189913 RepID=A0A5E4Q7I4_9NEOP|nr:unnamed protein product [Leptidea sinapis]